MIRRQTLVCPLLLLGCLIAACQDQWGDDQPAANVEVTRAVRTSPAYFGTWCQGDFENGWQPSLQYSDERCSGFNNRLDDTDTLVFNRNLAADLGWDFRDEEDQIYNETVDLVWLGTHGYTELYSPDFEYTAYAVGSWIYNTRPFGFHCHTSPINYCHYESLGMRFGDEGRGMSILAQYTCRTLFNSDGMGWVSTRWNHVLQGGLRYVTGSYDLLYDGESTDEAGIDFAAKLQATWTIDDAWEYALSDWWVDNDIAVLASGQNSADCYDRLEYMTWFNFQDYPRLRGSSVAYLCEYTWEG